MTAPVPAASPFAPRAVIGMVLVGLLGFVGLLYALGSDTMRGSNDGGAHAGGTGLNGFAALVAILRADGQEVRASRGKSALSAPGLLVLTPPPRIDGVELGRIVERRRYIGPTMIVAPKWIAIPSRKSKARKGWVDLAGVAPLQWPGFHDEIGLSASDPQQQRAGGWKAGRRSGPLPDDRVVLSAAGDTLAPLVESGDGRILAAYLDEADDYHPELERFAGYEVVDGATGSGRFPVVLVFEPDLLDNWGMADRRTAQMARDLIRAVAAGSTGPIMFDMTQNGYGAQENLLTLAFRPPFLAATLCLVMAGLAIAWRAFNRFGPPRRTERAITLGKTALVENSAGVIRRAGRLHLVTGPYAFAARERIAALLGLPRGLAAPEAEAAIDHALEQRGIAGPLFSKAAADLRAARNPHEVARRAAVLQTIERALT